MPDNSTSRPFLVYFAAAMVALSLVVGCSSSNDEPSSPQDEPVVDEPATGPVEVVDNPLRTASDPLEDRGVVDPPGVDPPSTDPVVTEPPATDPTEPVDPESEQPFDPIAYNGEIFEDWPAKPALALVITGRQDGYIEPCGCAGLDKMKGGMGRRHSFLRKYRDEKGWPIVTLDVGGMSKGSDAQAVLKYQTMLNGMRKMGYDGGTLGTSELRLPVENLVAEVAVGANGQSLFFSANVGLWGPPGELTATMKIVESGGMKIGITGILGTTYQKEIQDDEIKLSDPAEALKKVLPKLKQEADYLVLLAHATVEESKQLAEDFPEFQLVVTAGGPPEPPQKPTLLNGGKTHFVEVGQKAMYAVVLAMFPGEKEPTHYQRVPFDSRFAGSADMKALMGAYQDALAMQGYSGLGIPIGDRAPPHPQAEPNGKFTGSKACQTCHEESYRVWKKSGHGRAFATLVEADPPRMADPECISCHVIGWHPTEFFPYRDGYESREKTPKLINVGCETCHGPGSAHDAAEQGSDLALQEKFQKAMIITKAEAQDHRSGKQFCRSCHDLDNSPEFDFETYWPKIDHSEEEQ